MFLYIVNVVYVYIVEIVDRVDDVDFVVDVAGTVDNIYARVRAIRIDIFMILKKMCSLFNSNTTNEF